jgi:hypothetical protein
MTLWKLQPDNEGMTQMPITTTPHFTATQQAAIDKIADLLTIENETGTVTRRARNVVLQGLSPADLAAIASELVKMKL